MDFNRPKHLNGGQSQTLFYHLATLARLEVWTEYTVTLHSKEWSKPYRTRFDAVIVSRNKIVAIVECKDHKSMVAYRIRQRHRGEPTEQEQRYMAHGVPLILVNDREDILDAIEKIKDLIFQLRRAGRARRLAEARS